MTVETEETNKDLGPSETLSPEEAAEQIPAGSDDEDLDTLDDGSELLDDEGEEESEEGEEESEDEESEEDEGEEESEEDEESEESEEGEGGKEDEGEEESEEDEGEEDKGKGKKGEPRIPKSRLDAVNARYRQEQQRNRELQARLNETEHGSEEHDQIGQIQSRLDEIDDEMSKAIIDGDNETFKKLRTEERQLVNQASQIESEATAQRVKLEARYEASIDKIEQDYPQYDPNNDAFDKELLQETVQYRDKFIRAGDDPDVALREAVAIVYPRYYSEETETEVESLRSTTKAPAKPKRNTKTPVKRNKKAAQAQPADTSTRKSKTTSDSDVPDVMRMTDEQLDALDEKTLAKLRGDFVE